MYELPPILSGRVQDQLHALRDYLVRLVQGFNSDGSTGNVIQNGSGSEYASLRGMISRLSQSSKDGIKRLDEEKLASAELPAAINTALAQAKESGEFDGRGISSIVMNENSTLTVKWTDGTEDTILLPLYAVGDVFITSREGEPQDLLGYGQWEELEGFAAAYVWKRTA